MNKKTKKNNTNQNITNLLNQLEDAKRDGNSLMVKHLTKIIKRVSNQK